MVIGIIFSLALLMLVAYRGFSVIALAPVCAILAALTAGMAIMPTYTELFMPGAGGFVRNFFPLMMLGAIFGKIVEETGAARSIAQTIGQTFGAKHALAAVAVATLVLTYGGVNSFVVAFAVYPVAALLFRQANLPKRLIGGTILLGCGTATQSALPGTPSLPNIIPTKYFGTDIYAAPMVGLIASAIMLGLGFWWLEYRRKTMVARGEGYGSMHNFVNEPVDNSNEQTMPFVLAITPLVVVLVLNFVLTTSIPKWDPKILESFPNVTLVQVRSSWAIIISLFTAIILSTLFGWNFMKRRVDWIKPAINAGAIGSLLAVMNTASEVGYGSVISKLPGFKQLADFMMSLDPGTPLVSAAVTINVLSGVTGSASGGLAIALESMGAKYLAWGQQVGVSPEILHRVATLAAGGLDTLPHNGAVITILAICGLTHRSSYPDIGMVCVVIPLFTTVVIVGMSMLFPFLG